MQTILVDDQVEQTKPLIRALEKLGHRVSFCRTKEEALTFITYEEALMFVVDLDLGPGKEREGVELVKELREAQLARNLSWQIWALSSHDELQEQAIGAGADEFIPKQKYMVNALAVERYRLLHQTDLIETEARGVERELARLEFGRLKNELRLAGEKKIRLDGPIATIQQLLDYRYLRPAEEQVLSALEQWTAAGAKGGGLSAADLEACEEAAQLLEDGDDDALLEWVRGVRDGAQIILPWLGGPDDVD